MKLIGVNKPQGEGYQVISAKIAEIEAYGGMVLLTSGFHQKVLSPLLVWKAGFYEFSLSLNTSAPGRSSPSGFYVLHILLD